MVFVTMSKYISSDYIFISIEKKKKIPVYLILHIVFSHYSD